MSCHHRFAAVAGGLVLCVGIALTAARTVVQYQTPGPFDPSKQGMCDFHNGIYFPTRALLAGTSPYGDQYARDYPVARQIPFFSPSILVLHAPFAVLPIHVAETLYFLFSVGLVIIIASLCAAAAGKVGRLDWILPISAGIVFSRAGHITLFDGYFTLELILATFLAVHFAKDRPWWSAVALVIVSAKPTYILPLGFLMLARGDTKPILFGAVFSVLAAAGPLAYLAYHEGVRETGVVDFSTGINKLVSDVRSSQELHVNMEDESPVNSWTRLDLLAVVCKFTGQHRPSGLTHLVAMFAVLAVPMIQLRQRLRRGLDDGLSGGTGAVILLGTLTSLYHQSYDALLVLAPLTGLVAKPGSFWSSLPKFQRRCLGLLMVFPLVNYLSTQMVLSRVGFPLDSDLNRFVTSWNGIALGIALLVLCFYLTKYLVAEGGNSPVVSRDR